MNEMKAIIMKMSDTIPIPFLMALIEMVDAHREEIEDGMAKEATHEPIISV